MRDLRCADQQRVRSLLNPRQPGNGHTPNWTEAIPSGR